MTIVSTGVRRCNEAGKTIIKDSEGLRLEAYTCPAGVWTIGYGHTGADVTPGLTITNERADELLAADLDRFEVGVARLVHLPISDNAFSALVSFSYNIGLGALETSTLLKLVNGGDMLQASDEFPKWNKSGGKALNGLTKRREAERSLFLTPDEGVEALGA